MRLNRKEEGAQFLVGYVPGARAPDLVSSIGTGDNALWTSVNNASTSPVALGNEAVHALTASAAGANWHSTEDKGLLNTTVATMMCGWVRTLVSPTTGTRFMIRGRAGNENWSWHMGTTAADEFRLTTRTTGNTVVLSGVTLVVGRWHFVAGYFVNGVQAAISVDGGPITTGSSPQMTNAVVDSSFIAGNITSGAPGTLNAEMADLQWFDFPDIAQINGKWFPIAEASYKQPFRFLEKPRRKEFVFMAAGPGPIVRTAALNGTGTLSATAVYDQARTSALNGTGTLSAVYDLGGDITRSASMSGLGTLAAVYTETLNRNVAMSGVGTLTANYASIPLFRSSAMAGAGVLTATPAAMGGWQIQPPAGGSWENQSGSGGSWTIQ